jgi:hypothetical protein
MGEIAEMMTTGVMCAMCGVYLECEVCEDMQIPMYCSEECFNDSGESKKVEGLQYRICNH